MNEIYDIHSESHEDEDWDDRMDDSIQMASIWTGSEWLIEEGGEPTEEEGVQAACDAAVDAIAALAPSTWAGWVIYLLEQLDGRGEEADFRWTLEGVTEAIVGRLEIGRW
jgi:hypothetical protein